MQMDDGPRRAIRAGNKVRSVCNGGQRCGGIGVKMKYFIDTLFNRVYTETTTRLMEGTGGIRKLRWSLTGKGKSGGARVIYLDVVFSEHLYLITAFPKNQKANLSKEERNQMKALVAAIKQAEKEARNGGKQGV